MADRRPVGRALGGAAGALALAVLAVLVASGAPATNVRLDLGGPTSPAEPLVLTAVASAPPDRGGVAPRAGGPAPTPAPVASPDPTVPEPRRAHRRVLADRFDGDVVAAPVRPVVVLYGDSLAWEAQDAFAAALADRPDVRIVLRTFGGTAICDWLDRIAGDTAELRPGVVVVEFSGNALTPCMLDADGHPLGGDAYLDRYAADAVTVIETVTGGGARLVLAGAPIARADTGEYHGGDLDALYRQLAATPAGVDSADAGAAVLDRGRWTHTLPCLPDEPCTGTTDDGEPVNVVRAPDGNHFCPVAPDAVEGVTGTCPVWSSGAHRYGNALARPVLELLGPTVRHHA